MSELRWNKDKHDDNVSSKEAAELEAIKQNTLAKIQKAYLQKAMALKSRKRTPADVSAFIADLKSMVTANASHPSLKDWLAFTLRMLSDKEEELRLTGMMERNCLTPVQNVPYSAALPTKMQAPTVRYTFETRDEFDRLQYVQSFTVKDGFVCFLLQLNVLFALYEKGQARDMVPVGAVVNGMGLERIPSVKDFERGLKAFRKKGKK